MSFLSFSRKSLLSNIPFIGNGRPEFQKVAHAPGNLKVKEVERSQNALNGLLGYDELGMRCSANAMTGDKVVVDTGQKLVQIQADSLDLKDVKRGDDVEFKLDSRVDPGNATEVKGKVVATRHGQQPSNDQVKHVHAGSEAKAGEVAKPLDKAAPVDDLIARRAMLFQDFKSGTLDQDSLRESWDSLRKEALHTVVSSKDSYYTKQAALQQLLDIGAFTPDEAKNMGFQVVSNGYQPPTDLAV